MRNVVEQKKSMSGDAWQIGRVGRRRRDAYVGKVLVIGLLAVCVIGTQWRYVDDRPELTLPRDASHGLRSFSVHVLTCASSVAKHDCTRQTAHDVKDGPMVYGQLMCTSAATKIIAREQMRVAGPAGYLKIACEPAENAVADK